MFGISALAPMVACNISLTSAHHFIDQASSKKHSWPFHQSDGAWQSLFQPFYLLLPFFIQSSFACNVLSLHVCNFLALQFCSNLII